MKYEATGGNLLPKRFTNSFAENVVLISVFIPSRDENIVPKIVTPKNTLKTSK